MANKSTSNLPIDVYLRILIISLILMWCFLIAQPFLIIIIWAVIISVAFYPVYAKVLKWFKGKRGLTVAFFVLAILSLVAIPSVKVSKSVVKSAKSISNLVENKSVKIPPPNENVKEWPVIGNKIYAYWNDATTNLEQLVTEHSDQITGGLGWLFKGVASLLKDVFISIISLFVAGFFLYSSESSFAGVNKFTNRLIGDKGEAYVITARDTIRSVVQGILLVAIIQAVIAYAAFAIMGIPAAALWALLVLMLAVVQMPVILVTAPMIFYGFSIAETTPAIIFAVFMLVVGIIDNVLKPIFLGRGLEVPMLIILIGSLGGMILHGIVGLFVGAVVLAIGYQTYKLWLDSDPNHIENAEALESSES